MQFANSQLRSSCFAPRAIGSPGGKVPLGLLKKQNLATPPISTQQTHSRVQTHLGKASFQGWIQDWQTKGGSSELKTTKGITSIDSASPIRWAPDQGKRSPCPNWCLPLLSLPSFPLPFCSLPQLWMPCLLVSGWNSSSQRSWCSGITEKQIQKIYILMVKSRVEIQTAWVRTPSLPLTTCDLGEAI